MAASCFALDPGKSLTQYAHRIWGQEQGLFEPTVYSILQTHDGFLWLGTQDGLIRFDGVHFREYQDGAGQALFDHSVVRALLEDRERNLWIASIGDGAARIAPDSSIKRYTTASGLPSNDAFCLASDSADNIWICTNRGLTRFSPRLTRTYTTADGLTSNQIRSTCVARDGTQWVAGLDFGLNRGVNGRFEPYSNALISPRENVTSLLCGSNGAVWVGTSRGVFRIRDGVLQHLDRVNGLSDNEVSALAESPDGTIWVGARDGITRYQGGLFSVYRTRDGLSHSLVLALYTDREGSLWAGTKDGLDQFTNGNVTPYTSNEGLLGNDTGPVLQDVAGRLWIATQGRGLNIFESGPPLYVTSSSGLLGNTVLSLALDRKGDVWVGTNEGLNRFRGAKLVQTYTVAHGLSGAMVRALMIAEDGSLWVGTNAGLDRFDGHRFVRVEAGKITGSIVSLGQAPDHGLFIALEDAKFFYMHGGKLEPEPLNTLHAVDCYVRDPADDSVWMGTLGSGLLRWKNGAITHLRTKDGLYDNRIYSMLRDDQGNLWFGSSKGVFRVSEKEMLDFSDGRAQRFTSIPFSTGQLRFECSSGVEPEAYRTDDGRLWFATNHGVVTIDPHHLVRSNVPPPVSVTAVVVNGRRIPARRGIDLGFGSLERNVEIRYAGLSLVSPEKVTFRYMLRGFDKTWTDAGDRREAFFMNLPPGHFQFCVSARNADGVWSLAPATFDVTVEPRLYQRRWFVPALILLACFLGLALYRRRIRRLSRTFDVILAERTRIARELHDTLLQGLSGVTMQLQALWTHLPASRERTTLGEIIEDASRASREARESLRGLRADPGSAGFAGELSALARDLVGRSPIVLDIKVDPVTLAGLPEVEFQLLRIAREALTNSLKHAMAAQIKVRLTATADRLRLVVEDDGIGLLSQTRPASDGHFGVVGMRERAENIGAEFSISDRLPHGTKVMVELKVANPQDATSNRQAEAEHPLRR